MNQIQYADRVLPYLEKYTVLSRSPYKIQCRCPICGDSRKSRHKMRGYMLESNERHGEVGYYCHNCGAALSLPQFLENEFPDIYRDYRLDVYRQRSAEYEQKKEPVIESKAVIHRIKKHDELPWTSVLDLKDDHPVRRYLRKRGVVNTRLFYLTTEWMVLANAFSPEPVFSDSAKPYDHSRIVTAVHDRQSNLVGMVARAVSDKNTPRYMIIKADDQAMMLHNIDRIDLDRVVPVCEGVYDAEVLTNATAQLGLSKSSDSDFIPKKIWVLDNEPDSPDVVKRMSDLIEQGETVVDWTKLPAKLSTYKDVSSLHSDAGLSRDWLDQYVRRNAVNGLQARVMVNKWSRVGESTRYTPKSPLERVKKFQERLDSYR